MLLIHRRIERQKDCQRSDRMPPQRPVVNGSYYTTSVFLLEGRFLRSTGSGDRLAELSYNPSSKGMLRITMNIDNSNPRFDPEGETRAFSQDDAALSQTRPYWQNAYGAGEPAQQYPAAQPPVPSQPSQPDPLGQFQPIRVPRAEPPPRPPAQRTPRRRRRSNSLGCLSCFTPLLVLVLALLAVYLLFPLRTNLLVMGVDRVPEGTALGRTDTIIMMSVIPLQPEINVLSIPRDLWLDIPNVGPNRINTAHFFAEGEQTGSGPRALQQTIQNNFGVRFPYYIRLRFDGFVSIVDAMGGVSVELAEPMSGYDAGTHRLNGEQALAFARDRAGTDDFFRMARGQLMMKAMIRQMARPATWPRLPVVAVTGLQAMDTNLPVWHWPRIGFALLRAGSDGIDNRTISREMVLPFTTDGGAQVLAPNWDQIRPVVREMFGP
jgi:polyisoprenyl-teichoic acid--peptidoglycan teichoic acid transferase